MCLPRRGCKTRESGISKVRAGDITKLRLPCAYSLIAPNENYVKYGGNRGENPRNCFTSER